MFNNCYWFSIDTVIVYSIYLINWKVVIIITIIIIIIIIIIKIIIIKMMNSPSFKYTTRTYSKIFEISESTFTGQHDQITHVFTCSCGFATLQLVLDFIVDILPDHKETWLFEYVKTRSFLILVNLSN